MNYTFHPIKIGEILQIKNWFYKEGYMQSIFMKPYLTNYAKNNPLKGPGDCDGFSVYLGSNLFGLFEYYVSDDIEIGLAINPKYVGQGYAKDYIKQGLTFAVEHYAYKKDYIKLTVEISNIPAYRAYLKTGFIETERDDREIKMIYKL